MKRKKRGLSWQDWKDFTIIVVVLAFILSFNFWGVDSFSASTGLKNWFVAIIVVALSLLIHHLAHHLYGLYHGYEVKHKLSWWALTASVLITLLSSGRVLAFMAMGVYISFKKGLGKKAKYAQVRHMNHVAIIGPLASLVLALIARYIGTSSFFFDRLFVFNLLFAAYSLLPIPPLDGSRILFASRLWYVFALVSITSFIVMIYSNLSFALSLNFSLIIGAVAAWAGYLVIER